MKRRSLLKQGLQRLLSIVGVRLVRMRSNRIRGLDPFLDLQWLLEHRADPVIFDVGANDGEMIKEFLRHFRRATIVAFEPAAGCSQRLRQEFAGHASVRVEELALGAARESRRLHLYSGSNMNSLLPLDHDEGNILKDCFAAAGTAEVTVETLDHFCMTHHFDRVDLLKVDTQGCDLHVLQGAAEYLKQHRIRTILVEVNFIPLYQNQARFSDIHDYLGSLGYRLVDLYNHNRHRGYTAWCDACYVAAEPPPS